MELHDGSSFRQVQAHLGEARRSFKAGEFDAALEMVDRALDIDPQYLAARALREKIAAAKLAPPSIELAAGEAQPQQADLVSLDNFVKLEERVRHRRVERRLEGARAAIRAGQLGEARAAISELIDLDPDCPELAPVDLELAQAEQAARAIPSRGPWFAVAITFATVMLCAAGLLEFHSVVAKLTRPPMASAPATEARPAPIDSKPPDQLETAGHAAPALSAMPADAPPPALAPVRPAEVSDPVALTDVRPAPASVAVPTAPAAASTAPVAGLRAPVAAPIAPIAPPTVPVDVLPLPVSKPPPALPPATPLQPTNIQAPIAAAAPNEDRLVRNTLQRYRSAYEGLDAKSAQQVWPTVDEPALARAFDDLESQSLTFDDCAVELNGVLATATCRGSTRYTPRTGSREPRVEPRVWNFTLSKINAEWHIESARVGR